MAAQQIRTSMSEGVLHSFPASQRAVERRTPRYFSEVQTLDREGVERMLGVTKDLVARANAIVDQVDRNRHEARMSGIETIAIELSAILEGGKLGMIEDALEEAVRTGDRPAMTIEGFSKLRRTEFLVGEVDQSIDQYAKTPIRQMGWQMSPYAPPQMGASLSDIPMPLLILGVIGAGAILAVVIIALTKK